MSAMLDVEPKKRPTALELCKHPWFQSMDSLPDTKLSNIQDYNLVRVSGLFSSSVLTTFEFHYFLQHNLDATFNAINTNPNKSLKLGPIGESNLFKRRNERTAHQQQAEKVK